MDRYNLIFTSYYYLKPNSSKQKDQISTYPYHSFLFKFYFKLIRGGEVDINITMFVKLIIDIVISLVFNTNTIPIIN